ncbi:phage tail assembly protein [Polymorphum gilvum]|uniref:Uncharacterized protein n=1 Tax=Polymorphum gilvum (strain LMG 25793 / CGMCC 1.9160 / SL003B-26A1) TaxID=991905 RepID=F2J630_POLGS|nr:phage tail assembly protein [Polymorphum gilvum]ADZ72394.1 hypothetical protein SL003B_3974 [Polymorphum gilvum SL003B-26A1]
MTDPAKTAAALTFTIQLTVPAEEGFGAGARRHMSLAMRRPRVRHVKQVVALLGPDFVRNLMAMSDDAAGSGASGGKAPDSAAIGCRDTIAEALALLTDPARLDGLTGILADLCGVSPEAIDDLDPADLISVGRAMFRFFPDLSGLVSTNS